MRKLYFCCDCDVSCILNCETPNLLYAQCLRDLCCHQLRDPDCNPMLCYLERGDLPQEDRVAKKLILGSVVYELESGVLFPDKTLQTVVPQEARRKLFDKTHAGMFGAHQRTEKIHAIL